jgi:cobalt-zinc-cadmium resistance protein CzcA
MIRQGAVTRDGRGEAVVGIVMMLMGANARVVVDAVKARMAAAPKTLPPGSHGGRVLRPNGSGAGPSTRSPRTSSKAASWSSLVLLLLLGNLRGGLIVAAAIPLSMLVAFIGMQQLGSRAT